MIKKPKLTYIKTSDGDWCVLYLGQIKYYEGHSIPTHIWLDLLHKTFEIENMEIEEDPTGAIFPHNLGDLRK